MAWLRHFSSILIVPTPAGAGADSLYPKSMEGVIKLFYLDFCYVESIDEMMLFDIVLDIIMMNAALIMA